VSWRFAERRGWPIHDVYGRRRPPILRRMRRPPLLAIALAVPLALSACAGGDTSIYVRNETDEAWYVAVLRKQTDPDSRWVVRVNPGADAFAVSWDGGPDVPVDILGPDCQSVGHFQKGDGDTWVVLPYPD